MSLCQENVNSAMSIVSHSFGSLCLIGSIESAHLNSIIRENGIPLTNHQNGILLLYRCLP